MGAITMTQSMEVAKAKPVRKVDPKEALEPLAEEEFNEATGLTRLHVKALKDGSEGFVTVKGNKGTAFVDEVSRYVCIRGCPLEPAKAVGGAALRELEKEEVLEVVE